MRTPVLIATTALALALAGCAKKPPATLPPAPVAGTGTAADGTGGAGTGSVDPASVPGSQANFVANVASDRVFFALDEAAIDAEDRATLASQARWLNANPTVRATIEGHADERGTREYNLALGEKRANAAKNALVAAGVEPSRLTVLSYGKERPDAPGSDEASWARNRRAVTVTVR